MKARHQLVPGIGLFLQLVVASAMFATTDPGPHGGPRIQQWSDADREEAVRAAVANLLDVADQAVAARDYKTAIDALQRLQTVLPKSTGIANNLAVVHAAAGHQSEALEWFGKAVELEPTNTMAVGNLALALLDKGDIAGMEQVLKPWRDEVDRYPDLGLIMMKVAVRLGRKAEVKTYQAAVLAAPKVKPGLLYEVGQLLLDAQDLRGAESVFRRVASEDPKNLGASLFVAGILRTTGRPKEALAVVEDVLRRRPDEPLALEHRGLIHRDLGNLEAAVFDLDRATSRNPRLLDTVLASAECLANLGRPKDALLRLETLLEPGRKVPEHLRRAARRYKAQLEGEAGARAPAPPAIPAGHADAVRAALDRTHSLHPRLGWLTWNQAATIEEQPVPTVGFRLLRGSPRSMDRVYLWKTREALPTGKRPLFCIPPDPIPTVPPWMASVRSLVEKELRPIELTIGYDRGQREDKTFLAVGRTAPDRWFSITCFANPDSEAGKMIDRARKLDAVLRDRGVDAVVQAAANLLDTDPTGAGDRFIVQSFVPLADKQFLELYIRLRPAREALPDAFPALENGQRFHQHDGMGVVTQTFRWLGKLPVVESRRGPEPAVDTFTGKRVDEDLAGYECTGFVGRYDVTLQGRASSRKELPERLQQVIRQMFPNLTPDPR